MGDNTPERNRIKTGVQTKAVIETICVFIENEIYIKQTRLFFCSPQKSQKCSYYTHSQK